MVACCTVDFSVITNLNWLELLRAPSSLGPFTFHTPFLKAPVIQRAVPEGHKETEIFFREKRKYFISLKEGCNSSYSTSISS